MPVLRIPTPLRTYTDGQGELPVSGKTVADVLNELTSNHPAIKPHILKEDGELRPFVNLFVGDENVTDLQGLQTPLKEDDKLRIIPSIAGGSHAA